MTSYRAMDGTAGRPGTGSSGTQPPATAVSYSGNYMAGLTFEVTQAGCWLEGYWWWVPPAGGATAGQKFCLWSLGGGGGAGSAVITGSTITSGTLTAGWNYIPLTTPVQIATTSPYVAATAVNANFPDTQHQFGAGEPYAAGITNGPLYVYPHLAAADYTWAQSPFSTTNSDPAAGIPSGNNQQDILWLDVQVTDTAPPGYPGTWRLWPNKYDASPATTADQAQTFVLATEIHVTIDSALNAIWYHSLSGAASLATWCGVYDIAGPSLVTSNSSPAWKKPDGTTAAAGAGWVKCAFTGVTLLAGHSYKVAYYNSGGASGSWSPAQYGYFGGTGAGAAGITSGPLYAPPSTSGAPAYLYNSAGGSNTPPYSGLGTEPANGTFAVTGPQYPYLCVDAPGFGNGPPGAVAETFWADLEVTPLITNVFAGIPSAAGTVPAAAPADGVLAAASGAAAAPAPAVSLGSGAAVTPACPAASGTAPVPGLLIVGPLLIHAPPVTATGTAPQVAPQAPIGKLATATASSQLSTRIIPPI